VLTKSVQSPLRKVLGNVNIFGSVTNLSVHFGEDENGQITVDTTRVEIIENMMERAMSKEDRILQNFKHLGCDQFKESKVYFRARETCYRNKVCVEGRYCIERKIPLASGGLPGGNGFDEFVDEVVRLNTFRDCASKSGIVQFFGVILDDTGKQLKGYLNEAPAVDNLKGFLGLANKLENKIPWPVRELWIRHIVRSTLQPPCKRSGLRCVEPQPCHHQSRWNSGIVPERFCPKTFTCNARSLTTGTPQQHNFQ